MSYNHEKGYAHICWRRMLWQLVFRMQFAVCNSRLNSQLHSRMQFAIQNILQCVYIPKGVKQSGWGSGDKLLPM